MSQSLNFASIVPSGVSFHAMSKPSGSVCNLDCTYCFYLEKAALYPNEDNPRMNDGVLEAYIRNYIASHPPEQEITFTWQGGEPTLMKLPFFRRALELQKRYGAGRRIANTLQTNGLLLDDDWCAFFAAHDFLIGLSLDGPSDVHDTYRHTHGGHPTHELVMRAMHLLRDHHVRFNILACVNRKSAQDPLRVYRFLREAGAQYIQFIPVVERKADRLHSAIGLTLHGPGGKVLAPALTNGAASVTDWSVRPEDYGAFLTTIFDEWIKHDVGSTYVMNFEWALANYLGRPGAVCHHQPICGRAVVVEYNGDVYSCDHYVYPEYWQGNLTEKPLSEIVDSPQQTSFGQEKLASLPKQCRDCKMLKGCWGGCPKHRFAVTEDGESGLNYLCKGYYHFFDHVAPYLKALSILLEKGHPASEIMRVKLMFVRPRA